MNDQVRRNMPLFPIGIVKKLTELSARQIRYYEEHGLISPTRTEGNQRMFSFQDVDRLLEVKRLLERGVNLTGIKEIFQMNDKMYRTERENDTRKGKRVSDKELHRQIKHDVLMAGKQGKASMIQGQLSQFFH